MWPWRNNNKQLHLVLADHHLHAFIFSDKHSQIFLDAHHAWPLCFAADAALLPTQRIIDDLRTFITAQQYDGYCHITIDTPYVQQSFCTHTSSTASPQELTNSLPEQYYQATCIGAADQQYVFYLASIARPLLLQLQIIQTCLPIHPAAIEPPFHAQCTLFAQMLGSAYNQARVLQECDAQTMRITPVFSREFITRILSNAQAYLHIGTPLVIALGAYKGTK